MECDIRLTLFAAHFPLPLLAPAFGYKQVVHISPCRSGEKPVERDTLVGIELLRISAVIQDGIDDAVADNLFICCAKAPADLAAGRRREATLHLLPCQP